MQSLTEAVENGTVTAEHIAGGVLFSGLTDQPFVLADLERAGAKYRADLEGYWIKIPKDKEQQKAMAALVKRSSVIKAVLAARGIRAAKNGVLLHDSYRARQQRKAARELKEVYRLALYEHQQALKSVILAYEAADDPVEAIKLGYRRQELESVINELSAGLAAAGENAYRLTTGLLPEAREISRKIAAWQVSQAIGHDVDVRRFISHDTAALAVHKKYDKIAWAQMSNPKQAKAAVKQAISRGLLTGESPRKIAERLVGLFDGSTPGSHYRRAVRIAQTETNRIMSEAAQETYIAANAAGVKCKNRWIATLDSKTRESHRDVDGEVREVGEKFSNGLKRPGTGSAAEVINCRCCLSPVVEGFNPNNNLRLDNESRELLPYMTYNEWEKLHE